jgi:hypothetical protein
MRPPSVGPAWRPFAIATSRDMSTGGAHWAGGRTVCAGGASTEDPASSSRRRRSVVPIGRGPRPLPRYRSMSLLLLGALPLSCCRWRRHPLDDLRWSSPLRDVLGFGHHLADVAATALSIDLEPLEPLHDGAQAPLAAKVCSSSGGFPRWGGAGAVQSGVELFGGLAGGQHDCGSHRPRPSRCRMTTRCARGPGDQSVSRTHVSCHALDAQAAAGAEAMEVRPRALPRRRNTADPPGGYSASDSD